MALSLAFAALAAVTAAHGETTAAPSVRVLRDVAYGSDTRQRFDVYLPAHPTKAPVLFMVHGGAWAFGDKAEPGVVRNKVAYWLPRGYVLVFVNYRMLPSARPLEQAVDVASALAAAQQQAASWGADPTRFVLMGHSAGAHLVALLNAAPALAQQQGARPWRGAVSLDGAAMDVSRIMQAPHLPLYDRAFGSDPAYWRSVSPIEVLTPDAQPLLSVCSSRRSDSCMQSALLERKAATLKLRVTIWEQDLAHGDINRRLGESGAYTDSVARWISSIL